MGPGLKPLCPHRLVLRGLKAPAPSDSGGDSALASHVFIVRRGGEIFCKAAADFGASGVKGLGESAAAERLTKWKSGG